MTFTRLLIIIGICELIFLVSTRLVLYYFPWWSVEAESIRTVLRIATAALYWRLFRTLIQSRTSDISALRSPFLITALFLCFLTPILTGYYQLPNSTATLFALTSVAVGIKEEFLFRGIIQNILTSKFGILKSVTLTSTIFTATHIGVVTPTPWIFAEIFLMSILLGFIYIYSGSIAAVIVIHSTYDAILSFTPLLPITNHEIWGFILLLSSVLMVVFWSQDRRKRKF